MVHAPETTQWSGSARSTDHDRLARRLPRLREALEHERKFRREQLTELHAKLNDRHRYDTACLPGEAVINKDARALREVTVLVAAGAEQALADIERALARMRRGVYGRCHACDTDIGLAVLLAIPKSTLCLACRRRVGHSQSHSVTDPTHDGTHPATASTRAAG